MASGTKLQLKFGTAYGEKTWTFNYAKSNASSQNVNTLMDTMITNGSIYRYPPLSKVSAKLVVTSETDISVS